MEINALKIIFGILLSALFFSNNFVLFVLTYVFIFIFMATYTLLIKNHLKNKILLVMVYLMIMIFQLVYNVIVVFSETNNIFNSIVSRIVGIISIFIPFVINKLFSKNFKSYLPSVQDITVFTFNEIIENINSIKRIINKGRKNISKENIEELLKDIPRHNSFRYINKDSLTEDYFDLAYQALNDPNIYIIISNTGSPASEIISMFTRKRYNHASLSFDKELKTIISYNGGERVYPPGLNMEMIKYFNKKQDSSIIVYSVPILIEQKRKIIEKIEEINKQGNAYNLLGLVFKFSFKPNILFCSQFVYKIFEYIGIQYFEKKAGEIKPTDLIELDYYRKLKYEYEIRFNEI